MPICRDISVSFKKLRDGMMRTYDDEELSEDSINREFNKISSPLGVKTEIMDITSSFAMGRKLPSPRRHEQSLVSTRKSEVNTRSQSPTRRMEYISETAKVLHALSIDRAEQEKKKHEELEIQASIQENQQKVIKSLLLKQSQLQNELNAHKELHNKKAEELEKHYEALLNGKDKEIAHAQHQLILLNQQHSLKMKTVIQQQNEQFETQEKRWIEKLREEKIRWEQTLEQMQEQLVTEKKNQQIKQKVEGEMKEELLQKKFVKKLQKYEKKIGEVIRSYHDKELIFVGSVEELRRELLQAKSLLEVKEKQFFDELTLKDKRILSLEHSINEVEDLIYTAKTWRSLASDLANLMIHTCATVEELPHELWTCTTPGLFSSVYDEFHGIKDRPRSEKTYKKQREEFVVVQRLLLAKCLKFSKSIYERVKAEDIALPQKTSQSSQYVNL